MKAIIEFDLTEDKVDFNIFTNADKMASFIWDFAEYLRAQYKYAEVPDDIEKIRDRFYDLLEENDVCNEVLGE